MTAKQFFKSTAFKCIAVLLCVLLVSGVLLAVAYGFLEVTDEERFGRKIGVMYNGETVTATEQDISGKNTNVNDAKIEKLWYVNEKNDYLVQAASKGNGGNVTCWVTVRMQDNKVDVKGIGKVLLYAYDDPAEFVSYIGSDVYERFPYDYYDGKTFSYGDKTSPEYINTNASVSLTAICNDVNASVAFVKAFAKGGDISDPYENFEYKSLININKSSWSVEGEVVTYNIVTKANEGPDPFTLEIKVDGTGKITAYTIITNGCAEDGHFTADDYMDMMSTLAKDLTGKTLADIEGYLADNSDNGTLHTGATRSNELCYHAAAFALSNYAACLETPKEGN